MRATEQRLAERRAAGGARLKPDVRAQHMAKRIAQLAWVLVALVAAYGGYQGGGTAVALGWLFLVWTAPFGIIWWIYIYPIVLPLAPKAMLEIGGPASAIALAYLFWFVLVPAAFRWSKSAHAL
jgi:hypothetical protein